MNERVLCCLLQPVELRATKFLQYGSIVQLSPVGNDQQHFDCLSVTPSWSSSIGQSEDIINEISAVTIAPSVYPCQRSSFKLVHPLQGRESDLIKYNDEFYLENCTPRRIDSTEGSQRHMVVYSSRCIMENPSMDVNNYYRFNYSKGKLNQPIALTGNPIGQRTSRFEDLPPVASINCRWKFVHVDPEYRFENEGQPIPVDDPVLIIHSATNKFLSVEWQRQILTLIGPETGVSVKYRPSKSVEKDGMWQVVTNRKDCPN